MSELIVEMEIPKNCYLCPMSNFFVDKQTYCRLTMRWEECTQNGFKRPSWCPIKGELPDEHGDLIDADTVLWGEEVPDSEWIVVPVTIGDVIEGYDVPIVIAAERKDDGTTAD